MWTPTRGCFFPFVALALACGTEDPAADRASEAAEPTAAQPSAPQAEAADESTAGDPSGSPICNHLLTARDIPFATAVFPTSDACFNQRTGLEPSPSSTVTDLRRGGAGSYCLSGQLSDGEAKLVISFDHINDLPMPDVHGPLDASALGVAAIQFNLDDPPASGLTVAVSNVTRDGCGSMDLCINTGFFVMNDAAPRAPLRFTESGLQTLRLADFEPGPDHDSADRLDTTRFAGIELRLSPGVFDFCVHDVRLLDASGTRLLPAGG